MSMLSTSKLIEVYTENGCLLLYINQIFALENQRDGVPFTDVGNTEAANLEQRKVIWEMLNLRCSLGTFSVLLGKYLEVELLSHGNSIFNFLRDARLFSEAAAPVYIPTSNAWGFPFSTSSSTLVIVQPFDCSHPSGLWQSFYNKKQPLKQYCGQAYSLINHRQ